MLNKKQIEVLMGLLEGHLEDAREEYEASVEENDGVEEALSELNELENIQMALDAMLGMNVSSDVEELRAENAMLKKIIQGVAGNLREMAERVSEI